MINDQLRKFHEIWTITMKTNVISKISAAQNFLRKGLSTTLIKPNTKVNLTYLFTDTFILSFQDQLIPSLENQIMESLQRYYININYEQQLITKGNWHKLIQSKI